MTEKLKQFLETAEGDAALTAKLEATKTPQDFLALAAEKGFELTEEELSAMTAGGELSDDELDDVAGGMLATGVFRDLFSRIGFLRFMSVNLPFRSDGTAPGAAAQQTVFRSGETPALSDLVHRGGPVRTAALPFSSEDEFKFVNL